MDSRQKIIQRLRELFKSQQLAVLATQKNGQPYASLVAFAASRHLRHLYFVTPKTTRKFDNLSLEPRVSLLIDSSRNLTADFHQAVAVTAVGDAREASGTADDRLLALYLKKHPHLADFARAPTSAMIDVTVEAYYLVQNFQNVTALRFKNA